MIYFTFNAVSFHFTFPDIDECINQRDICPDSTMCVNMEPGYQCACQEGFVRVGTVCIGKI